MLLEESRSTIQLLSRNNGIHHPPSTASSGIPWLPYPHCLSSSTFEGQLEEAPVTVVFPDIICKKYYHDAAQAGKLTVAR